MLPCFRGGACGVNGSLRVLKRKRCLAGCLHHPHLQTCCTRHPPLHHPRSSFLLLSVRKFSLRVPHIHTPHTYILALSPLPPPPPPNPKENTMPTVTTTVTSAAASGVTTTVTTTEATPDAGSISTGDAAIVEAVIAEWVAGARVHSRYSSSLPVRTP